MAGKVAYMYLVLVLRDRVGELTIVFLPRGIFAAFSQTLKMAVAHVWQSTRYELAETILILHCCCNLEC